MMDRLAELQRSVSERTQILTDAAEPRFVEAAKRWSDINRKTPGAIVMCANEADCQQSVQWAVAAGVPFVARSGGHSEYSTIGATGIVIDVTPFADVVVNESHGTAVLRGGVLSKQVSVKLAEHGRCTAIGNGNTVGAIPYFLNGGTSNILPLIGFGSDQIVSARLVTAKGELVEVSEGSNPELLYGLRGAGQYFGLVTELTVRTYPLSVLGNPQGVVWSGMFIFPLDRVNEVARTMTTIMDDARYATGGLMMIASSPPPDLKPVVMIAGKLLGNPADAPNAYKPLYDLGPMMVQGGPVPIQNLSDALEPVCRKGGFKRFSIVGLTRFDEQRFLQTVDIWKDLLAKCPDAVTTSLNFEWHSHLPKSAPFESANCLHDVRFWQNNLIWHSDEASRKTVDEHDAQCLQLMRGDEPEAQRIDYPNGIRGPIQHRYRGSGRLAKLQALKRQWDPAGIFTSQLL